jgi:hypothetical protein
VDPAVSGRGEGGAAAAAFRLARSEEGGERKGRAGRGKRQAGRRADRASRPKVS